MPREVPGFIVGAGWVDLDRSVAEGRREDGVRYKATTDPDSNLTVVEHADGRQDAIARPKAVRVRVGGASGPRLGSTCNCCQRPHGECHRARRGR